MKRTYIALFLVLCTISCVQAQVSFVADKRMPDLVSFLPGPPSDKDALYKNDVEKYKWGKEQRGTLRGDTAIWDARTDVPYYMQRMGWAVGKPITPESCPNLARLMKMTIHDIHEGTQHAKKTFHRHRPYQVFKEHTSMPDKERANDYTSFPSGHSARAWAMALVMVTIDPDNADAYMKVGYEMGESRVITGNHFESDVEAARLYASAGFARLCAEPTFWAYLQLARQELQTLK